MLLHGNMQSNSYSFEPVQASIWHCLNNYAYEDAIFLAERLNAEAALDPTVNEDSTLHLLATTYYRSNNKLQCYDLLRNQYKSTNNLNYKSRFLLAKVAADLNKLPESEKVLLSNTNKNGSTLEQLEKSYNEISSFALKLYARICLATDRVAMGKEAFQKSLKINPLLWESFEQLCRLNNNNVLDCKSIFQTHHLENLNNVIGVENIDQKSDRFLSPITPTQPIVTSNVVGILHPRNTRNNNNRVVNTRMNLFTSTPMNNQNNSFNMGVQPLTPTSTEMTQNSNYDLPSSLISPIITNQEEPPRPKKLQPCLRTTSSPWQQNVQNSVQQQQLSSVVRRSSRLFNTSGGNNLSSGGSTSIGSLKENNKSSSSTATSTTTTTTTSTLRSPAVNVVTSNNSNKRSSVRSFDWLLQTLRECGEAYLSLTRYECQTSINKLTSLKLNQQNTAWVYGTIAKCFYELADYEAAIRYYGKMRSLSPNRLAGLEWMSTALWHLQKEVELSVLSQDLLAEVENKNRAETWIVIGNCFSLQKEHEQAIKFFKRAIQVNKGQAYAYTLLGHEYVTTEELEKALRCFRSASRIDATHYNSWYGMGMIYYKQERFTQAEIYYKKAINIHPHNSVLLCHLGVVQNALNRTEKSLATFNLALRLNPSDPLCKFHRASVLFAVNRLDEALKELQELKRIVPKESLVHFLIAKIYSKKGDTHKALLHFSWATDLDPKGANNHIKESIEPVLSRSNNSQFEQQNNSADRIEEEEEEIESDLTL